jgi:amino acid transporter
VPVATYSAVSIITILFALVSLAIVTALGSTTVVEQTAVLSQTDPNDPATALGNPAEVVFHVAKTNVGGWLGGWAGTLVENTMHWLVVSSLFAGLLAFQNSASRYFFSMGRSQVLPGRLGTTNRFGAPASASALTSIIACLVIVTFAVTKRDPILHLFQWFSGMTALAIVLVEALVSVAVVAYFRRTKEDTRVWHTLIAPILAFCGLMMGEYLLMSRFGLLAGTADDPEKAVAQSWYMNGLGWLMALLPVAVLVLGSLYGLLRRGKHSQEAIRNLVS